MAGDHHQWQDMPITTVLMYAVRNTGPEQSCAAMKPGALCTQTNMHHNPSHCPQVSCAQVAPSGRHFQDLTTVRGRNRLISSSSLFRAKFMPTCSYANIALGLK